MLVTYSHSRAAVLCLGGWGTQVMLHLAPRIQAAQEQRAALGATGPDLNRIISFGVVLPDPILTGDGMAQFTLRRPRPGQTLPPYYIERLLTDLRSAQPSADDRSLSLLTSAERRARQLTRAAEPMLEPLQYEGHEFRTRAGGQLAPAESPVTGAPRRATRADFFRAGVAHTDTVARLLETHLLDPIRQDYLSPDDPFVQTTLYVVAPFFEPLAAALVWPIVSGLMARVGRRHISTLIGLFATGSYAADLSRPVEDAGAAIALAELETLTGHRHDPAAVDALAAQVNAANPSLRGQIGETLFDHIYLLDREKSNQGLAEDSHELAILAGNALEAFVVGSGDLFVQEQLGYGLRAGDQRPYSLVGAAADYVPLQPVLHAVNRQEESRLVREWVLRNTPEEPSAPQAAIARLTGGGHANGGDALLDLGFSQPRLLARLAQRMPGLFAQPNPATVDDLEVRESFVFPTADMVDLRGLPPAEWEAAFEKHLDSVRHTFELAAGPSALDEVWGLATAGADTSLAFAAGLEADERIVPQTLVRMHKRLLDLLAASPTGLTRAHAQTQRWLHETDEALQKLQVATTPSLRELVQIQQDLALREWQAKHKELSGRAPSLGAVLLRALIAVALVALLAQFYLWAAGRSWSAGQDGLALAGFAAGILVAGFATYRYFATRVSRMRRARVELARAELTARLRAEAHDGLIRTYSRLSDVLRSWQKMLREAMEELHRLSTPPEMPAVPSPALAQTYLYAPYLNQPLWDRCLAFLRSHLDAYGQRSEERLDTLWGQAKWRQQMQRILRTAPVSSGGQAGRAQAHTIAELIRQIVRESVAPVSLEESNPLRGQLIRALAADFSIERVLWRRGEDAQAIQRRLRAMGIVTPEEAPETAPFTQRRYVEAAWHRAKPTANYDVADRLAVYGVSVDFAAVSGNADSDLTRSMLEEFNIRLLPTENPFTILFVRTVHGLALDDLDCMRRYRREVETLTPGQREMLLLAPYSAEPARPPAPAAQAQMPPQDQADASKVTALTEPRREPSSQDQ
jgi:hypothetical protein